jgi:hypothetical protein
VDPRDNHDIVMKQEIPKYSGKNQTHPSSLRNKDIICWTYKITVMENIMGQNLSVSVNDWCMSSASDVLTNHKQGATIHTKSDYTPDLEIN